MMGSFFRKFYLHVVVWTILLLFPFVYYIYEPAKIVEFTLYSTLTHFLHIIFLAANFYLFCYFLAKRYFFGHRMILAMVLTFGFVAYVALTYTIVYFNPGHELVKLKKENNLFFIIVAGAAIVYPLCIIISSIVFLYDEQVRQKELNKQIALEKTTAELTMLKLQISPHFLFNTLNNIRWLVRKQSPDTESTIIQLSDILRYILYEVEGPQVKIFKEIAHMQNFIALQTLRLPIEGKVALHIDNALKNRMIQPLLFIHFVENAFKYGVDSKNKPEIQFQFTDVWGGIIFSARNKILQYGEVRANEGIGLTNVRRRLQLLYPDRHELSINKTDEGYFDVTLKLTLDEN